MEFKTGLDDDMHTNEANFISPNIYPLTAITEDMLIATMQLRVAFICCCCTESDSPLSIGSKRVIIIFEKYKKPGTDNMQRNDSHMLFNENTHCAQTCQL